jgi:hypothetical protein
MRVLHAVAHREEQFQALDGRQPLAVAVAADRLTLDVLHDEVGETARRLAGVEHLGDRRMVHKRQGLTLGLEAGDDLFRVHAGLDQLDRHAAPDRLGLLREPDLAHAALADLLKESVGTDRLRGRARGGSGSGDVALGGVHG